MPYQCTAIGPTWNAIGLGVMSITTRSVARTRPGSDRREAAPARPQEVVESGATLYWPPHGLPVRRPGHRSCRAPPPRMNTEFNWWLLTVGIVVGAGLVWLVLADVRRREDEVGKAERRFEAAWIA